MRKGILTSAITTIALLSFVIGCASQKKHVSTKSTDELAKIISHNLVEKVDPTFEDFPSAIKQMGEYLAPEKYPEVLSKLTSDPAIYTLTALAQQVVAKTNDPKVVARFNDFFIQAAKSHFDWTKSLAIKAMAKSADMADMHLLISFLDADNPIVVDEALLTLKSVFDRQESEATRAPASALANNANVYDIPGPNHWKSWAKNNTK